MKEQLHQPTSQLLPGPGPGPTTPHNIYQQGDQAQLLDIAMAMAITGDDEFSFPDLSNVPSSISFIDSSSPPLWKISSSSCPSMSSGLPEIEKDSHHISIGAEPANAKEQEEGDKFDDAHGNEILRIRKCCYSDAEEEDEDKMDKLWEELNEKEACGNGSCMVISSTRSSRRPGGVELAKVLKRILHPNTSRRVTKSH